VLVITGMNTIESIPTRAARATEPIPRSPPTTMPVHQSIAA
jgi:hypothetical protein